MDSKSTQAHQLFEEYKKSLLEAMNLNIEIHNELAALCTAQMQASIKAMNQEITKNLSAGLSEYVRLTMHENFHIRLDIANIIRDAFKDIDFSKIESDISNNEHNFNLQLFAEDYVTFNETTAKELDISDTIAVPIGKNRVRMKTSDFIALLALIATIIGFIYNAVIEHIDTSANNVATQQLIEIEQERNQILNNLLISVDYSNSSNREYLEEFHESLLGLQSDALELKYTVQSLEATVHDSDYPSQALEVNHDYNRETEDSNPE